MKKIICSVLLMFILTLTTFNCYAYEGLIDSNVTSEVYKFSDDKEITLPFFRFSMDRVIVDKNVNKSGLTYTAKNINVENKMEGIQFFVSADTVRLTGEIDYAFIVAPSVVLEGKINKTATVICSNLTMTEKAVISEDLMFLANKLEIQGNIEGNLIGKSDELILNSNISKDLRVEVSKLSLKDNFKSEGNIFINTTNKNLDIKDKYPNATINYMEIKEKTSIDIFEIAKAALLFALIYCLFSCKTKVLTKTLEKVKKYKVTTIISGALSYLAVPILILIVIILFLIGLGIISTPIAFTYLAYLVFVFSLSSLIVGSVIAEYIVNKYSSKLNNFWSKLVMSFVLFTVLKLLMYIPMIGVYISVALCMISAGIVFVAIFKRLANK